MVATVGPGPGGPGGMASVMEAYMNLPMQHYRYRQIASWQPDAPLWSAWPWLRSAAQLLVGVGSGGTPVVHVHLSERGSFLREGSLMALGGIGAHTVATLHGADFDAFSRRHARLVSAVLRRADAVVALGPRSAAVMEGVSSSTRVEIIPNPIEVPDRAPPPALGQTVLFAGEVGTRKGVDVLVEAWRTVSVARPAARLRIVGPPGDIAAGGDGVEVLGSLSRAEVLGEMAEAVVVVLPSRAEVMPMVLLEAMARARPVVTTPVGDVPYLLGGLGRLVPVGDAGALAGALIDVLDDRAGALREGLALRGRILATCSMPVVADRLEGLYASLGIAAAAGA